MYMTYQNSFIFTLGSSHVNLKADQPCYPSYTVYYRYQTTCPASRNLKLPENWQFLNLLKYNF